MQDDLRHVSSESRSGSVAASNGTPAPRVLIVDDDASLRAALIAQLEGAGFGIAGQSGSVAVACAMLEARPDVVLVDLGLPDGHGRDVIVAARDLGVPSLVLTVHGDDDCVFSALRAGASGYCLKSEGWSRIDEAIRVVLAGGASISPSIARRLLESFRAHGEDGNTKSADIPCASGGRDSLSGRERELMDLFAAGCTYAEAARIVGISINTVRHHVRALYEKLHVNSKAEAVAILYRPR